MKLIIFLFCIVGLTSCTDKEKSKQEPIESQYSKAITTGDALGLDVRSTLEFSANGSSLAINIPVDELDQRVQELSKDKTILVFCESGGRASSAQSLLKAKGFKNVVNIGDWRTWNRLSKKK